jgi:hypothetical protein
MRNAARSNPLFVALLVCSLIVLVAVFLEHQQRRLPSALFLLVDPSFAVG